MKLIVSCYSCSPTRGSEPGMGWGYLRAAAQHHDIWALVDGWEFEEELTAYHKAHPAELKRVHFIFIPNKPRPLLRKLWPPSYYWLYNAWHRRAYKVAKRLHEKIHFDAAWQLSMVTFREPGYLWKLPIPFIWGPVGALGYTDVRLLPLLGWLGGVEFLVRNAINWWQCRTLSRPRLAARKAAACGALFAATSANASEMKHLWGVDAQVLCEIGLDELPAIQETSATQELRLYWSGVFECRKALPLLLRALFRVVGGWKLDVLGDGPLRDEWRSLAERLGISENITWRGWLPRNEALEILQYADVVVVTSIHDLTSTVLVEAVANGKPIICLDHCGFSDIIDQSCGIKISIGTPTRMIKAFTEAMNCMRDPILRKRLSHGARQRAETFVWRNKTNVLLRLIEGALKHA